MCKKEGKQEQGKLINDLSDYMMNFLYVVVFLIYVEGGKTLNLSTYTSREHYTLCISVLAFRGTVNINQQPILLHDTP